MNRVIEIIIYGLLDPLYEKFIKFDKCIWCGKLVYPWQHRSTFAEYKPKLGHRSCGRLALFKVEREEKIQRENLK